MVIFCLPAASFSQIQVEIDLSTATHPVSPFLYGKNNSVSDNPSDPLTAVEWLKLRDAGVTFLRESGGNNSTKYNWRRKLSSHPDWYNNVYAHDWDFAAKSIQQNLPGAQSMFTFQLIGKAAKTSAANFNDWGHNGSQWWSGVNQNLAGGGVINATGGAEANADGDPELYLETWTADSTVGILDQWFGQDGVGLDQDRIQYWNMDNEGEIWSGTHDDVMPTQISAEEFMQRYFIVAKKARAKFPEIKLVGPVTANEWQWYNWQGGPVNAGGKKYPWLEFFIKRIAEEQQASGVRLLDVLDIHFYPSSTTVADVLQYHRVYFDKNYVFPEHNGVHNVNGSWDTSQTKEYIFQRCRDWLTIYMGPDHDVKFSVTETGISDIGPNGAAVWYASTLGEFMRQPDMAIFTPWHWYPAMWEVLHLFSQYNKDSYVHSISSNEEMISAYSTINEGKDSLSIMLVNRSTTASTTVNLTFNGFVLAGHDFEVRRLANISSGETFVSHTQNALQETHVTKNGNTISISLPPLSISNVQLVGATGEVVTAIERSEENTIWEVYPNPAGVSDKINVVIRKTGITTIDLIDVHGRPARLYDGNITTVPHHLHYDMHACPKGIYFLRLNHNGETYIRKVAI